MILRRALACGVNRRGSIAVEGTLAIVPLLMALVLNLELTQRARKKGAVEWAAFRAVRERSLGRSRSATEEDARDFLRRAFGSAGAFFLDEVRTEGGLSLRGHWRYEALWRQRSPVRHHFEVNELCRFPF